MKTKFIAFLTTFSLIGACLASDVMVTSETNYVLTVSSGETGTVARVTGGKYRAFLYLTINSAGGSVKVKGETGDFSILIDGKGSSLNMESYVRNGQVQFLAETNTSVGVWQGIGDKNK